MKRRPPRIETRAATDARGPFRVRPHEGRRYAVAIGSGNNGQEGTVFPPQRLPVSPNRIDAGVSMPEMQLLIVCCAPGLDGWLSSFPAHCER